MKAKKEYLNNHYLEEMIARFQKSKKDIADIKVLLVLFEKNPNVSLHLNEESPAISFEECKILHRQAQDEFVECQGILTNAFYMLSEKLVEYARAKWGWSPLVDAEDAIQDGVITCLNKIDLFDPKLGKAFNYMTTCVLNNHKQLYRTAKNFNDFKRRYRDHLAQFQIEEALYRRGKERVNKAAAKHSSPEY